MQVTLESLKAKVAQAEKELIEVRRGLEQLLASASSGIEDHSQARLQSVDKTGWQQWFDEWFQQMDITTQPIGAENLQALMLEEGVRPDDNLLSQGIIAMREE